MIFYKFEKSIYSIILTYFEGPGLAFGGLVLAIEALYVTRPRGWITYGESVLRKVRSGPAHQLCT